MAEPGELTAEIRWWWRGEAPSAVSSWFEAGRPGKAETRTDTYLLAGNVGLGIKQRGAGGGLEIKSLVALLEERFWPGSAELWIKVEANRADLPTGTTLAVSKTRRLLRIAIGGEQVIGTSDPDDTDCEVELGTAHVEGGKQWSSLCFEARATLDDPCRHLRAAWRKLAPPAQSGDALAASYPAWLERHACA